MSAKIKVKRDRKYIFSANFVDGTVNNSYNEENFECKLLGKPQSANVKDAQNRILVAETPDVTYVGKSYGHLNLDHAKGLYDTYVGVFDPATRTMQICDTQQFYMHSSFKEDKTTDMFDGQDPDFLNKNFKEKSDILTSSFGSYKRKRAMDSRLRNTVGNEELKGVLDSTIDQGLEQAQSYKQRRSEAPENNDSMSTIPPCNKDADNVTDVYKLYDIVSDEDLNVLKKDAQVFVSCTHDQIAAWRDSKEYPSFVLNHLGSLPFNEADRLHACCLLMYLSQMIYVFKMKSNSLNRKDALPSTWSFSIKQKLLNSFTTKVQVGQRTTRCLPSRLRDTLCSYIITLALIIDEFTLHLLDLQNDMGINRLKMIQHVKALGCQAKPIAAGSDQMKAELKLPLQFPKPGPRKGR